MTESEETIIAPRNLHILKSKFFYLFLSLIVYFVATSLLAGNIYHDFLFNTMFSFLIIFCVYLISQKPYMRAIMIMLALLILITHWTLVLHLYNHRLHIVANILTIIFLVFVSYAMLTVVTQHRQITADSLFGAICGYFFVGFTWTFLYILIALYDSSAFNDHLRVDAIHQNIQHFYYFSFSTMTTLGYGDILPLSNFARACAWLEAVIGQIYLAVWISQLVGLRIAQRNGS